MIPTLLYKKLCKIFFTLSIVVFCSSLLRGESFEPLIKVNGEIITNYDIEQRYQLTFLFNPNLSFSKNDVAEQLIDELLQNQLARKLGIEATKLELIDSKRDLITSIQVKEKKLQEVLQNNDISLSTLENFLSTKIIWQKLILAKYAKNAKISSYELTKPMPQAAERISPQIEISEIVIPFSERGKPQTILLIKRLHIELNNGGDFSKAAIRFSKASTAKNGGKIGFIETNSLPKQVVDITNELHEGGISKPIILQNSAVLFKLHSRKSTKKIQNSDYLVKFLILKTNPENTKSLCKKNYERLGKPSSLYNLKEEYKLILSRLDVFGKQDFLNNNNKKNYIVLCEREIAEKPSDIALFKDKKFKENLNVFADKLMIELRRIAIVERK